MSRDSSTLPFSYSITLLCLNNRVNKNQSNAGWLRRSTGVSCHVWRLLRLGDANSSSDHPNDSDYLQFEKGPILIANEIHESEDNDFVPYGVRYNKPQGKRPCLARVLRKGLCAFVITGFIIYHLGLPYGMTYYSYSGAIADIQCDNQAHPPLEPTRPRTMRLPRFASRKSVSMLHLTSYTIWTPITRMWTPARISISMSAVDGERVMTCDLIRDPSLQAQ